MYCTSTSNLLSLIQILVTCGFAGATVWTYFRITTISNENASRLQLDNDLNTLVKTWLKYPFLEELLFVNGYNSEHRSIQTQRYEAYCMLSFNFIEDLQRHFRNDIDLMRNYCDFEQIIRMHWRWWNVNQVSNFRKYTNQEFITLIESLIPADLRILPQQST